MLIDKVTSYIGKRKDGTELVLDQHVMAFAFDRAYVQYRGTSITPLTAHRSHPGSSVASRPRRIYSI